MKRNIRRFSRLFSIFHPRSIYKLLVHFYKIINKLTVNSTQEIIKVIADKKYKSYLEVGVWQGDSLLPIAKKFPDLICYGVDPYSGSSFEEYYKGEIMALVDGDYYQKLFEEISTKAKDYNNIKLIRKTSEKAAKDFVDESLDIVFIDARHYYESVAKDNKLWLPKVKVGGTLWS